MYRATEVLKYRQNYRFGASMTATIAAISLPCHPVDCLDSAKNFVFDVLRFFYPDFVDTHT